MNNAYANDGPMEDSRESEAMRKLFVGGLNRETTDETFFEYFGQFGNTVDQVVIKDPDTKMSRGFGFITYDQSSAVESCFASRPHVLDGKTLDVKRAIPKEMQSPASRLRVKKLFVGGVAPDLTPEEFQDYIESRHPTSIGTIDKIDFLKDKDTNKNKGFGFLECSSEDFADRLVISENSFQLNGKNMSLKKAEPKEGSGGSGGGGGQGGKYQGNSFQNNSYQGNQGGGFNSRGGARGGNSNRVNSGRGGFRGGRGAPRGGARGGSGVPNNDYNSYGGGYQQPQNYQQDYSYQNNGYGNYQQGYGQQQPSSYGGGYNQTSGGGGGGYQSNNRYQPY